MKVRIGQVLKLKEDIGRVSFLTERKKVYKTGTEMIVTSSGNVVYPDGSIQKLDENTDVSGYDTGSISGIIANHIDRNFDICDYCDIEIGELEDAIEEIIATILK